jgi:hypothetical protein
MSDNLKYLAEQCKKMLALEIEIEQATAKLQELQKRHQEINQTTIPDLFLDMGLTEIKLDDETLGIKKVTINKLYTASISADNWGQAKSWLQQQEEDAMIKTKVVADFGKGRKELEDSVRLMTFMKKENIIFDAKESIHPQTLKAFVKQRLEAGKPLPLNLFGVHVVNQTKVK